MENDSYRFFRSIQKLKTTEIIGIDEVGRGALAGPLLVSAVSITSEIVGVKDSKKIPALKRSILTEKIRQQAKIIKFGWATQLEIDSLGLSQAQKLAYDRVLIDIPKNYLILSDNVRIDSHSYLKAVRGDELFYLVSIASIVAKTVRDQLMRSYHRVHPHYDWHNNAGYGTLKHKQAIQKFGLSELHRRSFLNKYQ